MKKPNGNFFPIDHRVTELESFRKLEDGAIREYLFLCKLSNRYGDYKGDFEIGDRLLSQTCGMARMTMRKYRKMLIDAGFIVCEIKRSRTKYHLSS